jgi:hypothetical protein
MVVSVVFSEKWSGLRVPLANRSVDLGRETRGLSKNPNPRVRGVGRCLM